MTASGSRKAVCSGLKWAGAEWSLTLSGGLTAAVWLSNEVSRWVELRPGLRSVVLLAVRPVAQDVVDLRHDVGRHLRKDLSRHRKWKSVTGSEFKHKENLKPALSVCVCVYPPEWPRGSR